MTTFATVEDLETLWRSLKFDERGRAKALLEIVSDSLREEAKKVSKDLDKMVLDSPSYQSVDEICYRGCGCSYINDINRSGANDTNG